MKALVVEDDEDVQFMVESLLTMDTRFTIVGAAASAEEAVELAGDVEPELIVLDHRLAGVLTGLDAVPQLKAAAPDAKIVLFTAHAELRHRAELEPAVDGFLLKTTPGQLLPLAQVLTQLVDPW